MTEEQMKHEADILYAMLQVDVMNAGFELGTAEAFRACKIVLKEQDYIDACFKEIDKDWSMDEQTRTAIVEITSGRVRDRLRVLIREKLIELSA